MPSRFTRLLAALYIGLCLAGITFSPALAQSASSQIEDAQKMAQWGQNVQTLENRVLNMFEHPNFDYLIANISSEEEAETPELKTKFKEWETFNETEIAAIRNQFTSLPPMPKISPDADSLSAMNARKDGLEAMIDGIEVSLDETEALFRTAIYENEVDLTGMAIIQIESIQRILISESITIRQSLAATGDDHPQLDLSEQSILTNDFMHAYLQIQIYNLKGDSGLSGRESEMGKIEKTLKSYKKSLRSGVKKKDSYLRRLKLAKMVTSDDAGLAEIDFAVRIIESYEPSFAVEDKILESFREAMTVLETDAAFGDIEADLDIPMNKVYALIDERLKYDAVRQAIIANGQ